MKHKFVNGITLGLLLAVIMGGCSSEKKTSAVAPDIVRDVTLLDVRPAKLPDFVEAMGSVQAAESAQLASQVMGNVVAITVREGDHVKRGQVVALIDDTQLRSGVERAKAAVNTAEHDSAAAESELALATATLRRYQDLFDKKAVSPQEFDEVKARFQAATARREMARSGQMQAKAALEQAETMLNFTRIRVPFDGVITERRVDPGALAAPGMPLLTVEADGHFRLEATIDESNLRFVKPGETTAVQIDSIGDERLEGKLVQVIPAADPRSRSFTIKVELPANPQLRSGMFGRVYLGRGSRESLLIPRTAVVERGQLRGIYVVGGDQVALLRYITLGKPAGDQIEVLSGLQSGERLVVAPGVRDLGGKRIQ